MNSSSPAPATVGPSSSVLGCLTDSDKLYVDLKPFWYDFMALVTIIGFAISMVSNAIIIYLFTR